MTLPLAPRDLLTHAMNELDAAAVLLPEVAMPAAESARGTDLGDEI